MAPAVCRPRHVPNYPVVRLPTRALRPRLHRRRARWFVPALHQPTAPTLASSQSPLALVQATGIPQIAPPTAARPRRQARPGTHGRPDADGEYHDRTTPGSRRAPTRVRAGPRSGAAIAPGPPSRRTTRRGALLSTHAARSRSTLVLRPALKRTSASGRADALAAAHLC